MNSYKKWFVFVGDLFSLVFSFLVTIFVSFPGEFSSELGVHLYPFALLYVVWIIIFFVFNLYDSHKIRPNLLNLQTISIALMVSGAIGISMFYLFPIFSITPKTNLVINLATFGIFFVIWRRIVSEIFSNTMLEKIGILGIRDESQELFNALKSKNSWNYRAVLISNNLEDILVNKEITKIILAKELSNSELMRLSKSGIETFTLLQAYEEIYEKIPLSLVDERITVNIISKEKNPIYRFVSRVISIIVSLLVIFITIPFTLISALLIILEDGSPIFYKQNRVGKKHRIFKIWKFRSMKKDAEKEGALWASQKDTRVTKVGGILRKLHIDEIPQMINILKGDISLVGPRPERPEFTKDLEEKIPYYFLRHTIRPGFTGWAQIKFRYARSVIDSKEKFEYDLYYLKNRNLFMDIGIILKTIQIIFTH